jgi:predicted dehydrogenase
MPAWKQTRSKGGGVLLDLASHHIDLVRFLFRQEVRTVYAVIESRCSEHDTATLLLRLADGLRVQSLFSLGGVDEDRFEIYGQAGKLTVDRCRSLDVEFVDAGRATSRLRRLTKSVRRIPYLFKKLQSPWHEPSHRESLSRFVSAARERDTVSPDLPDLWDGYRSLEVICAAEESAQTGRWVSLSLQ